METIFIKCKAQCDTIFLTPNMLNTYVADDTPTQHIEYAKKTVEYQMSGKMDLYINSAVELAHTLDITVCDCYSMWKELNKTQDTTKLLINRINHPTQEMHKLFADALYETIFSEVNITKESDIPTTMFKEETNR